MKGERLPGSFRDPSGFLFEWNGRLLRQVNRSYADDLDALIDSGLWDGLVEDGLLVAHRTIPPEAGPWPDAYRILEPERLPFVSYPYEWSFSQLRDAALTTLEIQRRALDRDLILKDASAYNIQFRGTRPLLIDTLSFARYVEGAPWVAYGQFCRHFLAPLALMAKVDVRLIDLLSRNIDGVPLDLASTLLPPSTWARPSLLFHLHLHARSIRRFADTAAHSASAGRRPGRVGRTALRGLVSSLEGAVRRLSWSPGRTEWSDYESAHGYTEESRLDKERILAKWIESVEPRVVWDLGANTGRFSALAARTADLVVSMDADAAATDIHYRRARDKQRTNVLPLRIDLTNPSPALGWAHRERASLAERSNADLVLVLALVHHLAISNNLPLDRIAAFLAGLAPDLIIEFVPKDDPQVARLLVAREDIFVDYEQGSFEKAFGEHFDILSRCDLRDSGRRLYRMRRRS